MVIDQTSAEVREVEVPCALNIAAVHLRFHEYDSAIYECNKVLEVKGELEYSPDWVCKARFRRGQAQAGKRNFSAAVDDLNAVLKLKPEDTGVRRILAELKKEMEKYKQIEKHMYGKMFGKNV
ncbi:peptidyl-prolyl cis-trans isomerase D [Eurytemora carolleeae]|uniref:peptidyl-prolyl cis-trans isomerase D n=1 Tax=Eurytemora carolleeae TaxID=1294199 RepID=UPI000C757B5E|nr:peptidyl-prolyl cis-trans isomerase D [Eurytemora carolleeae]|eukprot:XP_023328774.1 peptidyl-prolyl cis-trans isomerase D-like [Eurytemora affinis]